ncbi:hypothetical protein [Pseudomonas sp. B28(2017)]|uniref:hypothetical protein n=1 Tax=Pseudomonas sp. B28(2017) TaxID=1981730 RepID=UPI000A1FC6F2|nr:hypothetical protein [Pseudomonas sp. B28(2017)]
MNDLIDPSEKQADDLGAIASGVRDNQEITKVQVVFDGSEFSNEKRLYANGRMQVRVTVLITGNFGGPPESDKWPRVHLIHYQGGQRLTNGWVSAFDENQYAHSIESPYSAYSRGSAPHEEVNGEMQGEVGISSLNSRTLRYDFWVSSSRVEFMKIAAEIRMMGGSGSVIYTNKPNVPGQLDESVTLNAITPATYATSQFTFESQRVGGEHNGDRIYRYYLGAFPGGRQLKLLNWHSSQYGQDSLYPLEFFSSGEVKNDSSTKYFMGIIVPVRAARVDVNLPGGIASRYRIGVNQREGELTIVQALSSKYFDNYRVRKEPFFFTAIDMYGTEHRLSIRTDMTSRQFILERG